MSVLEKTKLMEQLKAFIGDNTSDDALSFVEDVSDTFDDLHNKATGDGKDWKAEYEKNDAEWRQRYKDRFFSGSSDGTDDGKPDVPGGKKDPEPDVEEKPEPMKYEDLFSDGGKE